MFWSKLQVLLKQQLQELELQTHHILLEVQKLLNRAGYDLGEPDGIIGPKTIDAVTAIQLAWGQQPSGKADQDFLKELRKKER